MKKKIKRLFNLYRNSKIAVLITIFIFFLFGSAYLTLSFEFNKNEQFKNFFEAVYWSVITYSTTGYGDKSPLTVGGRLVAMFSVFIGIIAMSILSGTLASNFVDQNNKTRRGLMDFKNVKAHFVICGWKDNMDEILKEILRLNTKMSAEDIILVSNIESDKIEDLRKETGLRDIRYVKGDYFSEAPLNRANVKNARKVIILADTLESEASSEVDSKTVMTVLTARAISKDVYICAELIDGKFENYLKQAQCDEIILSRNYARMILASSSATDGISHIIYNLISTGEKNTKITTQPIPDEYINKPYQELKNHFVNIKKVLLLGILENAGSPHKMKVDALRDAQKTSDVSKLVANLQVVKELTVNKPVLLPDDEYIVKTHSMGIILERI